MLSDRCCCHNTTFWDLGCAAETKTCFLKYSGKHFNHCSSCWSGKRTLKVEERTVKDAAVCGFSHQTEQLKGWAQNAALWLDCEQTTMSALLSSPSTRLSGVAGLLFQNNALHPAGQESFLQVDSAHVLLHLTLVLPSTLSLCDFVKWTKGRVLMAAST